MTKPFMEKSNLSRNQSQKVIKNFKRIVEVVFHADLDKDSITKQVYSNQQKTQQCQAAA
jgi:hypothetical protein